jgi:hypothetical protein
VLPSFRHVLQIPDGGTSYISPNELIINSSSKIKEASLALGLLVAREVVGTGVGAKIVYW